jgi:iron uptake system component EfeO
MTMKRAFATLVLAAAVSSLAACSSSDGASTDAPAKTDAEYQKDSVQGMHDTLLTDIDGLLAAAKKLQAAAPVTPGRGWDKAQDAAAIEAMKAAWVEARSAYERIEGALAPIFPDVDASIDARYDDFLADLGQAGDGDLFDDSGVTGLHAVERILYSDTTPAHVVEFEQTIPGYKAAAFPATEEEATEFRDKLCAKLIADAQTFHDQWQPANIDIAVAFQGLISLMNEQREKVNKASTNEEESRYSQRTMADLRDNLAGTKRAYAIFQPWIVTKPAPKPGDKSGRDTDAAITAGFAKLDELYAQYPDPAIPQPPATWAAESPSPQDLATPFGQLFTGVRDAVDPNKDGSVVDEMNLAADVLGFPQFAEGQ